jgi:hypothetical protein
MSTEPPATAQKRANRKAHADQHGKQDDAQCEQHSILALQNILAVVAVDSVEARHNRRQAEKVLLRQLQWPLVRMVVVAEKRVSRPIELYVSAKHIAYWARRDELCGAPSAREIGGGVIN